MLFKIFEELPKDIGLYIVADEPTNEFIQWKQKKNLTNLRATFSLSPHKSLYLVVWLLKWIYEKL